MHPSKSLKGFCCTFYLASTGRRLCNAAYLCVLGTLTCHDHHHTSYHNPTTTIPHTTTPPPPYLIPQPHHHHTSYHNPTIMLPSLLWGISHALILASNHVLLHYHASHLLLVGKKGGGGEEEEMLYLYPFVGSRLSMFSTFSIICFWPP